jgi:hypothetical protein
MRVSKIKTLFVVVIALIALLVCFEVLFTDCLNNFGDTKSGKAKAELNTIAGAIRKLASELTPEELRMKVSTGNLAPLIRPMIENPNLQDPWGEQYQFEGREESGYIVVTVRSNRQLLRRCFEWERKPLAVEIWIAMPEGKIMLTNVLWR